MYQRNIREILSVLFIGANLTTVFVVTQRLSDTEVVIYITFYFSKNTFRKVYLEILLKIMKNTTLTNEIA